MTSKTKRHACLINNDGKNLPHKVIFEELVTERIDEIIALTNKINFEDLIHYLKRNITTKTFENFENGIKLFSKIKMWWYEARSEVTATCV